VGTPDTDASRMPITAHLEELRRRIFRAAIAIAVTTIVTFSFLREHLLRFMKFPMNNKVALSLKEPFISLVPVDRDLELHITKVAEAFWMHMKIAFVAGIFIAMPYIIYQLWKFISPGLMPKERRYALPFILSASIMFVLGGLFCQYFVLPFALDFLLGFDKELVPIITISDFVDFYATFILAFGAIFQLPLVISLLAKLGIVSPAFLSRNRKYAILLAFIAAAILTPTPDAFNQLMMAGPIIVFYEVGLILARFMYKKPEKETEEARGTDLVG